MPAAFQPEVGCCCDPATVLVLLPLPLLLCLKGLAADFLKTGLLLLLLLLLKG
jgi:hypothetical protein